MKRSVLVVAVVLLLATVVTILGAGNVSARYDRKDPAEPVAQTGATPAPTEVPGTEAADVPDTEPTETHVPAGSVAVTEAQARATALAANPGLTTVKVELSDENDTLVYSVELSNGADVKVDAHTGTVVSTDQYDNEGGEAQGDSNDGHND